MSIVKIDPKSADRPVLPTAGEYGAGKGGFDVELSRFECPAEDRMPAYDREGEKGPYAYFGFQCKSDEGGVIFYDVWDEISPGSGSQTLKWLRQVGVTVTDAGEFDPSEVAGRKVIIEVTDPRTDKNTGRTYNGYLRNVVGV